MAFLGLYFVIYVVLNSFLRSTEISTLYYKTYSHDNSVADEGNSIETLTLILISLETSFEAPIQFLLPQKNSTFMCLVGEGRGRFLIIFFFY